jgi:hypothetical protein
MSGMVIVRRCLPALLFAVFVTHYGWTQDQTPAPFPKEEQTDPFAGIQPANPGQTNSQPTWVRKFFSNNFTLKKELCFQLTTGYKVEANPPLYSRQSVGFEILKKFSSRTSTVGAFDLQSRLVRRDNYIPVLNDLEGADRKGFYLEYHNAYLDLYNILNPLMSDASRTRNLGRFNWRTGRFYLPFGLNLQTDTHGTLLQLSNEQNFGFDRDWYTGMYGSLTPSVNYDVYYLLGSGYRPSFEGQRGLLGARVSLGNRFQTERGLEGGISVMSGERLEDPAMQGEIPSGGEEADVNKVVPTFRVGIDERYTHRLLGGNAAFTTELSGGRDKPDAVFTQLHQVDYTSRSRKWGWAGQYRRFWKDSHDLPGKTDSSLIGEFTLYSRNDVTSAKLRWIKFNLERRLERRDGEKAWLFTVQYYYYW